MPIYCLDCPAAHQTEEYSSMAECGKLDGSPCTQLVLADGTISDHRCEDQAEPNPDNPGGTNCPHYEGAPCGQPRVRNYSREMAVADKFTEYLDTSLMPLDTDERAARGEAPPPGVLITSRRHKREELKKRGLREVGDESMLRRGTRVERPLGERSYHFT